MINFITILILIIAIIACWLGFTNFYKKIEYNENIKKQNIELQKENNYLKAEQDFEKEKLKIIQEKVNELINIQTTYQDNAQQSFANYCDILDTEYKAKEEEYNKLLVQLEYSYNSEYDKLLKNKELILQDLEKLKQTRAAAMEAARKEKEIEENFQFYSLSIESKDRNDIQTLERVKKELNNPRILSMLIWQTFFKDKMNELCNNVLGVKTITGIYKITNQETKECYIGQSVDIGKRFKDHAKCGLDIDRPQGNKLYQSMIDYGLWNFSFELLEECSKELLNEKEKFYISLYQSKDFGFNSTQGNK